MSARLFFYVLGGGIRAESSHMAALPQRGAPAIHANWPICQIDFRAAAPKLLIECGKLLVNQA
jgi:hypothetical protein